VRQFLDRWPALPASIDTHDVRQEAVLIVGQLADRWNPDGGQFGAYLRVSLPFELTDSFGGSRRASAARPCAWTPSATRTW
jgi:hypothetical protein